ncbi:hypothetical protein [Bacillus toyonensis]|uniref:hypothetical protein n=1 Tax=Bacillus toyonensis TaxID=155322 RepID=UPI000BF91445|nr:hypothetical protein [Bacillus toyonensis]PGF05278.1 hypothetical protein COM61_02380 [Bacillus toyonensis]
MNENEFYKPVVPEWVARILEKKKQGDPLATLGYSKEWENWKRKYSKKYKYAMLNGWIVEGE